MAAEANGANARVARSPVLTAVTANMPAAMASSAEGSRQPKHRPLAPTATQQ